MIDSSKQPNAATTIRKPRWISHRGLAYAHDENTLPAFLAARSAGFEAFETDLRTTADGELVLCHDISWARLGGPPTAVSQLTSDQASRIQLSRGGSPAMFEQLMAELPDVAWTFDIKPEGGGITVAKLIEALNTPERKQRVGWGQYQFLFWDCQQQNLFLQAFPEAQCYARYDECRRVGLAYLLKLGICARPKAGKVYSLPPEFCGRPLYRQEIVEYYHRHGAKLLAFLPSTEEHTHAAIMLGFDEILTNNLPTA